MASIYPPEGRVSGFKGARRRWGYPTVVCVLLTSTGVLAACSHAAKVVTTTTRPVPGSVSNPVAPSIYSVKGGRFIESVEAGDGVLVVSPPPKSAVPGIT